jgi:hypothetical protein
LTSVLLALFAILLGDLGLGLGLRAAVRAPMS